MIYADIKNLPSYKIIIGLGIEDVTTEKQEKNFTIAFTNNDKRWGIYKKGALRINIHSPNRSKPSKIRMYNPLEKIEDWDFVLKDFKQYLISNNYVDVRKLRKLKIENIL